MWTLVPTRDLLRRAAKQPRREVKGDATRTWQLSPPETTTPPAAIFLPDQLERVTGYEFAADTFRQDMYGGVEVHHAATHAYLIEHALLVDGILYKGDATTFLRRPHGRMPPLSIRGEIRRGAIYCTFGGNRYFGQWLIDDCVTYPLACNEGVPITTASDVGEHAAVYEQWLAMRPHRVHAARLREVVVFDDFGQNSHKRDRFRSLKAKLVEKVGDAPHPGVFIIRGGTGSRRILRNELELAEQLRKTRGFRIVDPMSTDVPSVLAACAGAQMVVGVEGSHVVHALMLMSEGRSLLTIQPPFRFCTVLKDVADREGIKFGFVVGRQIEHDFFADPDEVERTIDLMLK